MELQEIKELIAKYVTHRASPEEKLHVENWYAQVQNENRILTEEERQQLKDTIFNATIQKIEMLEFVPPNVTPLFSITPYLRWAAVILGISLIGYFSLKPKNKVSVANNETIFVKNYVSPGSNKAILILADGRNLILDNAENGRLASQGDAEIVKNNGRLVYNNKGMPGDEVLYNTVATPRGGQYQLQLPDGSKVWLNAASSLKFPTAFHGKERNVELTGEAYFEISKNASMPFHVKSAGQTIEVLGTHFDINAYNDETAVKTTLLEGSVKVIKGTKTTTLKPGQQSSLLQNGSGTIEVSDDADVDEVTAWKNGMFQFNDADIRAVMRQISRWYDVDIEFQEPISSDHYKGKVPRNASITKVLKILELSGVNFKIEGKKIIVK